MPIRTRKTPSPTARTDERITGLQRTGRVTAEAAAELRQRALREPGAAEQVIADLSAAPADGEPGSAADMARLFGGRA